MPMPHASWSASVLLSDDTKKPVLETCSGRASIYAASLNDVRINGWFIQAFMSFAAIPSKISQGVLCPSTR